MPRPFPSTVPHHKKWVIFPKPRFLAFLYSRPLYSINNMPSTPRPLGPITPNIIRKKHLSPQCRGKIIGASLAGITTASISRLLSTPKETVRRVISLADSRPHGLPLPKSGRPVLYSVQDKRSILRFIRSNPCTKYCDIKSACGLDISYSTIKRILRKNRITSWRAKKRPALTPLLAAKRLA